MEQSGLNKSIALGSNPYFNSVKIGTNSIYMTTSDPNGVLEGNYGDICYVFIEPLTIVQYVCLSNPSGKTWIELYGYIPATSGAAFSCNTKFVTTIATIPQPAIPASGTAYKNTLGYNCVVDIGGGTVSAIAINSETMSVTNGSFILRDTDTITLTYTVAPTWTWRNL